MKSICTPTRSYIQFFGKVFLLICLLTITQNATATIRYVKASATGAGTSWANASGDLKAIIESSAAGDEVWVAEGDYKTPNDQSFVMMPGVKIYGGFAGTETSLTQRNTSLRISRLLPYDNEVIIKNENNVLTGTALLDGFTISNATLGAVINTNASPAFANCTFSNNQTQYGNGGAMVNTACSPTITNCVFTQNSGDMGGAVLNYQNCSASFTNCTFSNNTSRNGGGALLNSTNGTPSFTNCTFIANKTTYGSGGCIYTIFNSPLFVNCTFTNNIAPVNGGVMYSQPSGSPITITGCTFTGNTATQSGGCLYNLGANHQITNCTFKGNSAKDGGAIYQSSYLLLLTNSVITGNTSSNEGGGVFLAAPTVGSSIVNSTIAGNTATTSGGGIMNRANNITIRNSIIYNNNTGLTNGSGAPTINNSLIQGIADNTNGNISGAVDPLFINPLTPGLSTSGDYRLQPCSPAVNKGNNSYYTSAVATDPDGNTRIYNNGIIDMGAYERTNTSPVTVTASSGIVYVKAGATGTGQSWDCATGNLQAAINAAGNGNQVWVAEGDYKVENDQPYVMMPGVKIYGGFAGTETSLTQRDWLLHISRLLPFDNEAIINNYNNGLSNTAVLDGFTIANVIQSAVININSSPTFNNCTFNNNRAAPAGGGIYNENASTVITNCLFTNNRASAGAGICSKSSTTVITNCTFRNNNGSDGAGIYLENGSYTITGCSFSGNVGYSGGGLYILSSSGVIANCNIKGNSAESGGGIYAAYGNDMIINCLLSGNTGSAQGGGIYCFSNLQVINCTISGNTAPTSGGIFNFSSRTLTIRNSIIYNNNTGGTYTTTNATIRNSIVQGRTANTDPLFVNPLAPGLSTGGDYRLQPCSPAINKGDNSYYTSTITTDLDSNARFYNNGIVDMGAYERTGEPPIIASGGVIYVKPGAIGTGQSWDCATGDLQAAINGAVSGNQLWVAGGTYIPNRRFDATGTLSPGDRNNAFALKNDVKVYGGFAGTETALSNRDLSLTANASILSGDLSSNDNGFNNNSENTLHVVMSTGNTNTTVLDGFTIQGGNCDGGGGAGIACSNSTAAFTNLIIKGNAGRYGAGLHIGNSSPTITNSFIIGNAGFYGGGIMNSNGGPILTNVLISGNTAVEQGGGMYSEWAVAPILTNVTIAGNTSTHGAGGAMYNNLGPAMQLRNCIVYGNSSGIYNNNGTPGIQYSLVQGETSTANGNIAGTVNPSFVNQPAAGLNTGGNYTLQVCSPAINAGSNIFFNTGQLPDLSAITIELNRANRNQGIAIDMGVYEYTGDPAAASQLGNNGDISTTTIAGSTSYIANSTSCRLLATLQPTGANALTGSVNTNVWVENAQPADYVKRHYQVTPVSNAANATGRATLYFTQAEFNAYNAVNAGKLPTGPTDVAAFTAITIRQYTGVSSNSSGLPNTYTAGPFLINPNVNDIIWNATYSRWEVSFDFTGYSGFFLTGEMSTLPVTLISFNGHQYNGYNQLQWETANEVNVKHFILERSHDGNSYTSIATIPAGSNSYSYKGYTSFSGKIYYRLRMVDNDGEFTYSPIVTLSSNGTSVVGIYPNPASDKVYISTGSEVLQHTARLYTVSGQLLQTITITSGYQAIPVQQLKSGLYLLQFDNGTTVKFIKK